jgi:hypothetical protein
MEVSIKLRSEGKEGPMNYIVAQQELSWRVIKLAPFRRTPGVYFDIIPTEFLPRLTALTAKLHRRYSTNVKGQLCHNA